MYFISKSVTKVEEKKGKNQRRIQKQRVKGRVKSKDRKKGGEVYVKDQKEEEKNKKRGVGEAHLLQGHYSQR